MLKQYLDSFFDNDIQKAAFRVTCHDIYSDSEFSEWVEAENRFKSLLPYGNLDNFYIEINERASNFIKKIFEEYVDTDTFVVGAIEHTAIQSCMSNILNKLSLTWDIIKKYNIDIIIDQFKQSNCKKIFVYGTSILNFQIVPQSFYAKLKERLSEENIEHVIVLDDVQGMFIVPRDYNVFDDIIFTCHALIPNYDSGILLSKQYKHFGYTDAEKLNKFMDALEISLDKKDKLLSFNLVMKQYFAEELMNDDLFHIPEFCSLNTFCFTYDDRIKSVLLRYKDSLSGESGIEIEDKSVVIRASFLLRFDTEQILTELRGLKKALQKCIKLKNRWQQ